MQGFLKAMYFKIIRINFFDLYPEVYILILQRFGIFSNNIRGE